MENEKMSMITPRVTVPVADLERVRDLLMERIYGSPARSPAHNARLEVEAMLSAAPAPEGGAVLALGTPVEVEFSEAEVGKQTLYVAGVDMAEPGMPEPEYWLSETWPVKCRGDVSTDWKRDMFSALATREEAPAEAGWIDAEWAFMRIRELSEGGEKTAAWCLARINTISKEAISRLRAQPPAREDAQPVGWLRAVDEEMVCAHLGVADAEDSFETAKKKLASLIQWNIAVATDPSVGGHPAPDALRVAVEALEPFAKASEIRLCGEWPDDAHFGQTDVAFYVTFGDLRRAASALAALQAEQKGGAA